MFFVIALKGCPYSIECVKQMNIMKLNPQVTWIDSTNKHQYKTQGFDTFPQITFRVLNNQNKTINIFIGGYNDFQNLITLSKNKITLQQLQQKNLNPQLLVPILYLQKKI